MPIDISTPDLVALRDALRIARDHAIDPEDRATFRRLLSRVTGLLNHPPAKPGAA